MQMALFKKLSVCIFYFVKTKLNQGQRFYFKLIAVKVLIHRWLHLRSAFVSFMTVTVKRLCCVLEIDMESKKISFGFSKSSKKPNIINKTPANEKKVELIECLEEQTIKIKE